MNNLRCRAVMMPKIGQNILYCHSSKKVNLQSLFRARLPTKRRHKLGVTEFWKYLIQWSINVSDLLYNYNIKNYFCISISWFCWYMLPKNIIFIIGKQMFKVLKNLVFENLQVLIDKKTIKQKLLVFIKELGEVANKPTPVSNKTFLS